jgi:hypothetical protein
VMRLRAAERRSERQRQWAERVPATRRERPRAVRARPAVRRPRTRLTDQPT